MLFIYSMNDQIDENKHTESAKTDTNSVADLLFLSMQLKFQQFKKLQTSLSGSCEPVWKCEKWLFGAGATH